MSDLIDLKGKTLGTREVLRRGPNGPSGEPRWHCRCVVCGRKSLTFGNSLRAKRLCVCQRAKRYEHDGKRLTTREWGRRLNIEPTAFYQRVRGLGIKNPRAFVRGRLSIGRGARLLRTANGKTTAALAAQKLGISKQALSARLKHGWSEKKATTTAKYATLAGRRGPWPCKKCGKVGHYAKTCGRKARGNGR